MNILMFTRYMAGGGTEKIILQLCKMLSEQNHRIVVCAAKGMDLELFEEMGVRYVEIPDIEQKTPAVMIGVLKTVNRIIVDEQIDIVHTHHRTAAFLVTLLKVFHKIVFINTVHYIFVGKKMLTHFAIRRAKNVAVGNSVKENLMTIFKIHENKISVIYNAVDIENTWAEPVEVIDKLKREGNFIVGNIGRINVEKGFDYYVEAAEIVKKKNSQIKFLIIGDGILRKEIEALVKEKNLEDTVIFFGFSDNVLNVLRKLDLVVLSSLWEGLPLTPIEAFAMGKTIVATAVSGTMEIVKNQENGIIVPTKDSLGIANAITDMYDDPEKKQKYEKGAKETFDNKFSYQSFCEKYLEMYGLKN